MLSRRIFLSFAVLLFLMFLIVVVVFYYYSKDSIRNAAVSSLVNSTGSTMAQVDTTLENLDYVLINLVSTDRFHEDMLEWSETRTEPKELRKSFNNSFNQNINLSSNAYRIALANSLGDTMSYGYNELDNQGVLEMVSQDYWMELPEGKSGKMVVPPHLDPWVKGNEPKEVVSIIRNVVYEGETIGYLEIQLLAAELDSICSKSFDGNSMSYVIIQGDNKVFSTNFPREEYEEIRPDIEANAPWYPRHWIETNRELMSIANSNYIDWKLALVLPKNLVYSGLVDMRQSLFGGFLVIMIFAVVFLYFITKQQTKELDNLINQIKEFDLNNFEETLENTAKGSYEVQVLSDTFTQMQTRLRESLDRENAMEVLQNKALYDALQSRISPHFLYNTLGSIANICITEGADEAANACFDLSDLLRYSGKYKEKIVTVSQELENLRYYFKLMKNRYKHRLEYNVHSYKHLEKMLLPKLTLQPLAENAIEYSLMAREEVVVTVNIYEMSDEDSNTMVIKISDNGVAFEASVLDEINSTLTQFLADPSKITLDESLGFGGMGLTGTLLRLYLYFGKEFSYELISDHQGETQVVLYIPLTGGERNL